jgi:hypothetical protein
MPAADRQLMGARARAFYREKLDFSINVQRLEQALTAAVAPSVKR